MFSKRDHHDGNHAHPKKDGHHQKHPGWRFIDATGEARLGAMDDLERPGIPTFHRSGKHERLVLRLGDGIEPLQSRIILTMFRCRMPAITRMLEQLREAGHKVTPQREAIVRHVANDTSHPTAFALRRAMLERCPEKDVASVATIYNTLSLLSEVGAIRLMRISHGEGDGRVDGVARFDPNTLPHDHAICDVCGAVSDLDPEVCSARPLRAIRGFSPRSIEWIVRGVCEACTAQTS